MKKMSNNVYDNAAPSTSLDAIQSIMSYKNGSFGNPRLPFINCDGLMSMSLAFIAFFVKNLF